jgi:hypothetical protein
MTWLPMIDAPKDGPILLDVGLPWAVVGCWNEVNEEWSYCTYAISHCDGKEDAYFETDSESMPTAWMYLPEILPPSTYQ